MIYRRWITSLLCCIAAACGDDGSAPVDGSTGTSGTAGSSGAMSTSTSSGATESSESGSTAIDPSGDTTSTGGPDLACAPGENRMVGELEGTVVDQADFLGGVAAVTLGLRMDFADSGIALLRAEIDHVNPPEPLPGWGYLRMPLDSVVAQQWYCFDDGSTYTSVADSVYTASLRGVTGLGACPGTPVGGTASLCFGAASCGGKRQFVSEVEGTTFTVPLGELGSSGGAIGATDIEVLQDLGSSEGGIVYLHAIEVDVESMGPQQSAVDAVYFIVPLGEEDGGAVYCAGVGSTFDYEMIDFFPEAISAEIVGVSRLGTCGPTNGGDDRLDICLNLGG